MRSARIWASVDFPTRSGPSTAMNRGASKEGGFAADAAGSFGDFGVAVFGERGMAGNYSLNAARAGHRRPSARPLQCEKRGGGGGIRTLEALSSLAVFKTAAFNRSATPPSCSVQAARAWPQSRGAASAL